MNVLYGLGRLCGLKRKKGWKSTSPTESPASELAQLSSPVIGGISGKTHPTN